MKHLFWLLLFIAFCDTNSNGADVKHLSPIIISKISCEFATNPALDSFI